MDSITVGKLIARLQKYPVDMTVVIDLRGGGGVSVERRDLVRNGEGQEVVGIFSSNGGRFGFNPLTEDEYKKKSVEFLSGLYDVYRLKNGFSLGRYRYTTIHGDHRIYIDTGNVNDTCYGEKFDDRIIDRLVAEGLIEKFKVPCSRDNVKLTEQGMEFMKAYFDGNKYT